MILRSVLMHIVSLARVPIPYLFRFSGIYLAEMAYLICLLRDSVKDIPLKS